MEIIILAEQEATDTDTHVIDARIAALKKQEDALKQASAEELATGQQAEQHNLALEEQRRTIEEKYHEMAKDKEGNLTVNTDEDKKKLSELQTLTAKFIASLQADTKSDFLKNRMVPIENIIV